MAQTFRVVPIKGLNRPFGMAFLPDGGILVTERAGRLRLVRNGIVDPQPIAGMPEVLDLRLKGLQDIALHPEFERNRLIYFMYYKPKAGEKDLATAVLGRARWSGGYMLDDVRDLFVAEAWCATPSASRIIFDREGKIFMTVGVPIRGRAGTAQPEDSQSPSNHAGKVLRLNDDGSAPADNPFAGNPAYRPEIYAMGIRNILGLALHPDTGELWEHENGPMGGDEINIVKSGRNYGWPVILYGRAYRRRPDRRCIGPAHHGPFGARHGAAVPVLGAVDRSVGTGVLHRRSVQGLEGEHLRRRDARHAPAADRAQREGPADGPRIAAERPETADP